MIANLVLRGLESRDADCVGRWLEDWLVQHIEGWVSAYGLGWSSDQIRAHIADEALVEREWREIDGAATNSESYVCVAEINREAVGIVYAEQRQDRYLRLPMGVVSWLYVAPALRGRRVAERLLESAHDWMRARQLTVSEVFATATNHSALGAYDKAGYLALDQRLIANLK